MARGKAAAAASEQPKKGKEKAAEEVRERDETEVDEDGEEAVEDDKENERPEKVDDEVEQQLDDEDDEEEKEEAMAGTGKRKKASSDSSSSKRAKASDAHSVVLAYMRRMNRPYSAINVADNLKNALSKTQTSRVLDDLVKDGHNTAQLQCGGAAVIFFRRLKVCVPRMCWRCVMCEQAR